MDPFWESTPLKILGRCRISKNIDPNWNSHFKKVMLCIWWDSKGVLFYEILKPGETVTSNVYKSQLQKLNEKIQELRPHDAHTPRKVLLLRDNARPHIAIATKNAFSKLDWEPLPHLAYFQTWLHRTITYSDLCNILCRGNPLRMTKRFENWSIFLYHSRKNAISAKVYISCPKSGPMS